MGCQKCIEYQDVVKVGLSRTIGYGESFHIDSIVMKANDSIIGCGRFSRKLIGSKTHNIKFPINVRVQLFAQGDLWKELFFEMDKNTMLSVYNREECSSTSASDSFFPYSMELAKKRKIFIDSSRESNYCWLLQKIDSEDDVRCTKWPVDGEEDLCEKW
jgi:hypothetical protein